MLNIRTRIQTDLNPSKRIRSRIRSENVRTVFILVREAAGVSPNLPTSRVQNPEVAAVVPVRP
jgi:hypothetical protein